MGLALWLCSALVAFGLSRLIRIGPRYNWVSELTASLLAALACGATATLLDFGGWNELEWRSGLFAFCGAMAASGGVRCINIVRQRRASE